MSMGGNVLWRSTRWLRRGIRRGLRRGVRRTLRLGCYGGGAALAAVVVREVIRHAEQLQSKEQEKARFIRKI